MKVLLTSDQANDMPEPYNYCIHDAVGIRRTYTADMSSAEIVGEFATECFLRYDDMMVQKMCEHMFICWDSAGDIVAALNLDIPQATFAEEGEQNDGTVSGLGRVH